MSELIKKKLGEPLKRFKGKKIKTTELMESLQVEIRELLDEGISLKKMHDFIQDAIGGTVSYASMRKWLSEHKVKPNIIAVMNFKGGAGKSTIANLLELDKKIIINLDVAQNAKDINLSDTYNYYADKEEDGIETVKEVITAAIESGKENIVLDTPGEAGEYLSEILDEVDFFIIPFESGERSTEATINTIDTLGMLLEDIEERKDKWCFILNRYRNESELEDLKMIKKHAIKTLGKERVVCTGALKQTQVVATIEKYKTTIDVLAKQNPIAYGTFKKRIRQLNQGIKDGLKRGEKSD